MFMDKELEKQFKELIEKNLPAHVGETLQNELKELERLRKGNFEQRSIEAENELDRLKRRERELKQKELDLAAKENDLKDKERELEKKTEINELKIQYEQKMGSIYNEVNQRILANRTIRETVQNFGSTPLINTSETKDYNGNITKTQYQVGSVQNTESVTTETEEK